MLLFVIIYILNSNCVQNYKKNFKQTNYFAIIFTRQFKSNDI